MIQGDPEVDRETFLTRWSLWPDGFQGIVCTPLKPYHCPKSILSLSKCVFTKRNAQTRHRGSKIWSIFKRAVGRYCASFTWIQSECEWQMDNTFWTTREKQTNSGTEWQQRQDKTRMPICCYGDVILFIKLKNWHARLQKPWATCHCALPKHIFGHCSYNKILDKCLTG